MAVAESLRSKVSKEQAVAYQLVTDQTNFLLIHERAESDKPADMPELHQVEQMLAAGWGGVGDASVRFCVMDSSHDYEIPMFSCKSMDSHPPVWRTRDRAPAVEKVDATPLYLCAWLRAIPEINWPTSYQGLRDLGVHRWVVEWLEIDIPSQHAKSVTEQVIVRTFLHVMVEAYLSSELRVRRGTANTVPFEVIHSPTGSGFRFAAEAFACKVAEQDLAAMDRAAQASLDIAATLEALALSARQGRAVELAIAD